MADVTAEDPINPAHYKGDYVMRIIEDFELCFLKGTILKYLLRSGKKANASELEDLKKAQWYLERKIAALTAQKTALSHTARRP